MTKQYLRKLKAPIVLCEGQDGGLCDSMEWLSKLLNKEGIKYDVLEDLYTTMADLSKYKTICFDTTGLYRDKINQLMNFDKSKVKTVVVASGWSYKIAEFAKAKESLSAEIIGFDWLPCEHYFSDNLSDELKKEAYNEIFIDAKKKWQYWFY